MMTAAVVTAAGVAVPAAGITAGIDVVAVVDAPSLNVPRIATESKYNFAEERRQPQIMIQEKRNDKCMSSQKARAFTGTISNDVIANVHPDTCGELRERAVMVAA